MPIQSILPQVQEEIQSEIRKYEAELADLKGAVKAKRQELRQAQKSLANLSGQKSGNKPRKSAKEAV